MKKVLIVSYVFPPMAAVGTQRVVSFCRFLPNYGWKPVVLTVKKGHNTSWDSSLLKKIPDTIVYRTIMFNPYLWLTSLRKSKSEIFSKNDSTEQNPKIVSKLPLYKRIKQFLLLFLRVPDDSIFWIPFAVIKGIRVVKKEQISIIISTSPPVTSHIIASLIARFTKIPHIVDFRDLWTLNFTYAQRNYPTFFIKYEKWWENLVLNRASDIITATPGITKLLQKHLTNKITVKTITNGFDYSDIDFNKVLKSSSKNKMHIVHTGSIYGDFNPEFFFESLSEWMQEKLIDPDTVSVDFYGNCLTDYSSWLKKLKLDRSVHFHGFISREELPEKLEAADYLLLLRGFKDEYKVVIPAKLFDYLATGIQILAIAPDGLAVDLIKKYQTSVSLSCQNSPDKTAMKQIIDRLYISKMNETVKERKYQHIQEIDRNYLTGQLAKILDQQVDNKIETQRIT